jgi:hypothetical protein
MATTGKGRIKNGRPKEDGVMVFDGRTMFEVSESTYRRNGYAPAVETLPWDPLKVPLVFTPADSAPPLETPPWAAMPASPSDQAYEPLRLRAAPSPPRVGPADLIRCPGCGRPSDSIKRYRMPDLVVFLFIFAWARRATYTACAGCMRKIIGERMGINLITANLCWPFLAIAWIAKLVSSYSKGHSESVLEELNLRR